MDRWTILTRKMEEVLQMGRLEKTLSHLDTLRTTASSPSDLPHLLANHTLKGIPTLHYLARLHFREKDIPHLDNVIGIFTDAGYDINKTTAQCIRHQCGTSFKVSRGFTALLASVEMSNPILVDCLLRHGARADVNDHEGISPCHLAAILGDLKCLEKLLQIGGRSLVASFRRPLLLTAVDEGRTEIVSYLLSKAEELGLDVNEEAKYNGDWLTPLGRAQQLMTTPITQALMKHPDVRPKGIREFHSYLKSGNTEKALGLLGHFSDEKLATDKIQGKWALHSLGPRTFFDGVGYTRKLILEYVARGWDVNSVSTSTMYQRVRLFDGEWKRVAVDQYNLLHLACLHEDRFDIVKFLLEEMGMDVNRKMEGDLELTPLQILLLRNKWDDAVYLMERGADLSVRGSCKNQPFTHFMRKDLTTGEFTLDSSFNSVELLIRMRCKSGLPFLDKVLDRPEVIWHGSNEFHLAVEGRNPTYISKVLEHYAKVLSKEDLTWLTDCGNVPRSPKKVPTIVWLLEKLEAEASLDFQMKFQELANLIKRMAQLGCDLNIVWEESGCDPEMEPLIIYILTYELRWRTSNVLLRRLLQVDQLRLNVTTQLGVNPLEHLMYKWKEHCFHNLDQTMETVQLLVTHGLDVSEMVIRGDFVYHRGCKDILKTLCRAGAKFSEGFFNSTYYCKMCPRGTKALAKKEKKELKKWKDEFDRNNGLSLNHICRLRVRKMLRSVGDLKMLDGLPGSLKDTVLGVSYGPSLSPVVSECELSEESESEIEMMENEYEGDPDDYADDGNYIWFNRFANDSD